MATVTVQIEGIDAVINKLTTIEQMRDFQSALKAIGLHVQTIVKTYPSSTEANSPRDFNSVYSIRTHKPMNTWYQRGYGPKWVRKDGSVGGRKTSEILRQQWTVNASNTQVVIGNKVSYAPFVHDADEQADFHKRRGWPTIQDVAQKEEPTIRAFVESYLERMMK